MSCAVRRASLCLAFSLAVVSAGCSSSSTPTSPDQRQPELEPDPVGTIVSVPSSGPVLLKVFDGSGTEGQSYLGYPATYTGGASVAVGDVNGDGVDDVVVGASSGLPRVRVIDGSRSVASEPSGDDILLDFLAFSTAYTGGVTVAAGDVNDDGVADIIVGAANGVARVRVVDGASDPGAGEVSGDAVIGDFFAFPLTYTGGVAVAAGDVNGDGRDDVIVGAASGTAHVRVFEGRAALAASGVVESGFLANFFAFALTYTGGVHVASGDLDGDGLADVVVGAAAGSAHVRVVESESARASTGVIDNAGLLADFFPLPLSYTGGVTVAAGDITGDGRPDILTGAATGIARIRGFDGTEPPSGVADGPDDRLVEILAYPTTYTGGVRVAASMDGN